MSDEDKRVPARHNYQLRTDAEDTKREYGVTGRHPVNIIKCLQSGWIPTRWGRRKLIYNVVNDEELGTKDGKTEFTRDTVTISVKKSVHEKATFGDGRARMTLAHELAHGVLHYGIVSYRGTNATGSTELAKINASESAEHQAKVFAAAFLIDDKVAATLSGPEEISTAFLVSLEAAEICYERLAYEAERAASAQRVQRMNEEFKAAIALKSKPKLAVVPAQTRDRCTSCREQCLVPQGAKYRCTNCGWVSDHFPDGDRPDT